MTDEVMERLYVVLAPLALQPECRTCQLCEQNVGLVYLLGNEAAKVSQKLIQIENTSEGVEYMSRSPEGWCPCFETQTKTCRIYHDRPLCCRLYPLDLMCIDSEVWWVIHSECPIGQRMAAERQLDILRAITLSIEAVLPEKYLRGWLLQDRSSQRIEAFSFDRSRVTKLRQYATRVPFAELSR